MSSQSIRLVFTAVLALVGLLLGLGGTWLVALGGSPIYLVHGLAFVAIGTLVWTRNPLTLWAYALLLLLTLAWAVLEVGLDWWQLMPRGDLTVALHGSRPRFDRGGGTQSLDRVGLLLLARCP